MADVLVGDYHFGCNAIAAGDTEVAAIDRSNEFSRRRARGLSPKRKDVDAQRVVFEKLVDGAQLIRPLIEGWNRRVRSGPAMRNERALLCRNVKERRRLALHVTGITSLFVAHIEWMRRLF